MPRSDLGNASREAGEQRILASPGRVLADEHGNLWIADTGHRRVVVADRHGAIRAVIGSGVSGSRDGALDRASFEAPQGLALSASGARLYVADTGARRIRLVDLDLQTGAGAVTTVAGTGERGAALASGPRPARAAALPGPQALALDEERGVLYAAMADGRQIWRLDIDHGTVSPCAGAPPVPSPPAAIADGPALEASFARPSGLALSADRKRLYIADAGASAVRVFHLDDGTVETLIGTARMDAGHADGPRAGARLRHCLDLTLSPAGLVVADSGNRALRGINLRHGTAITLWSGATTMQLTEPCSVALDRQDRSYVVADRGAHRLVRIAADTSHAAEIALGPARSATE